MEEKTFIKFLWTKTNIVYTLAGTTVSIFPGLLKNSPLLILIGVLSTLLVVFLLNMKSMFQHSIVIGKKNAEITNDYNDLLIRHQKHLEVYRSTKEENDDYKMVIHVVRSELYGIKERRSKEANEIVGILKFALEYVDKGGKKDGI